MTLAEFLLARITEDEEYGDRFGCDDEHKGLELHPGCRARVLAECQAKRRIIARCLDPDWALGTVRDLTLRHLAAVYAAHPDYRQEWKP